VALIRALDQVTVFCLEKSASRSVVALRECFRAIEAEGK